jgi:hypothetical protein
MRMFENMALIDRAIWFTAGWWVGFFIGWLVKRQRDTTSTLKEIRDTVNSILEDRRNEGGFVRNRYVLDVFLLVIVCITAYAAFRSEQTSDRLADTQEKLAETQQRLENTTACNRVYLGETIDALNQRTTYTVQQAQANLELQKEQARYLGTVLVLPQPSAAELRTSLQRYFSELGKFTRTNTRTIDEIESNPYPTPTEFSQCLISGTQEEK